mgnify:CR=1 FL=1
MSPTPSSKTKTQLHTTSLGSTVLEVRDRYRANKRRENPNFDKEQAEAAKRRREAKKAAKAAQKASEDKYRTLAAQQICMHAPVTHEEWKVWDDSLTGRGLTQPRQKDLAQEVELRAQGLGQAGDELARELAEYDRVGLHLALGHGAFSDRNIGKKALSD